MCGIVGFYDLNASLSQDECLQAVRSIAHRGPDNESYLFESKVFLGHRRLSILDLSESAHQPLKDTSENVWIAYNGEVYNFRELKKEKLAGEEFQSTSDTEVILKGYIKYGTQFIHELRGIFAFAILDRRNGEKIILARDPGGIKPLYISKEKNRLGFASEIKALKPVIRGMSINSACLKAYLNLGYCPEPYTIYNEVQTLEPGTVLEFSSNGYRQEKMYQYKFDRNNGLSFEDNLAKSEELVGKAISRNLIADVDIAVALSGGIDSSLVYYYANKAQPGIKGLTVRFDDKEYDESDVASEYARSVNGQQQIIDIHNDFGLDVLNKILLNFDQPYSDSSAIPVYYLTKATSQYSKVLVGGDGGDELYNGYPSQTWLYQMLKLKSNGLTRMSGKAVFGMATSLLGGSKKRLAKRLADLWNDQPEDMLYDWHSWFSRHTAFDGKKVFNFSDTEGIDLYKGLLTDELPSGFDGQIVFDYFRKTMLSDYLRKTDMMSMLNGVEYRVPILDEDLTSFALSIPFEQKSTRKQTKIFLREIHKKAFPPRTSQGSKKGFAIPLDKSLSSGDFKKMKALMLDKSGIVTEYVNREYVEFLFKALEHRNEAHISRASVYQRILMLYSLELWHSTNF